VGTAGNLGSQLLAQEINGDLNSVFVIGQTGLGDLSLVNMAGVELAGVKLTSAQAKCAERRLPYKC
jgi:hypothetical protein